jgi:hypothetical protein
MLTLRDELLPVVELTRGLVGDLGMHQPTVLLRTCTWSGGEIDSGTQTTADLILGAPSLDTPGAILPPHVKGAPTDPVILVGPLTPFHPITAPRGYTLAQLNPGDAPGVEYYFLVTWPGTGARRYHLEPRGLDASRPMRWMLKLEATDVDYPF